MRPYRFFEITPESWHEAKLIGDIFAGEHIFRGHADSNWKLETTLRRAIQITIRGSDWIRTRERQILKKFKSRAFQYLQSPPSDKEYIEWLSLIQHHGGPSRLLDFSESFYIASFFALEAISEVGCVWAISPLCLFISLFSSTNEHSRILDELKLEVNYERTYLGDSELLIHYAESFFENEAKSENIVLRVIPPRLSERLAVQKGVFLFPCNVVESFEYNLCKTLEFPFDSLDSKNATQLNYKEFLNERNRIQEQHGNYPPGLIPVVKINMPKEFREIALQDLHRMNIDYASLFPGLDGFAKSLKMDFDSPISIKVNPPTETPKGADSDSDNP